MVLPVPVSHMIGRENAISLASRLSAGNGYRSLRSFLASGRLSLRDLYAGEEKAIAKLARWSGAEPTDLSQFAVRTQSKWKYWSLGHANFNRQMRIGNCFRYCPACTLQDFTEGNEQPASRPFMRAQWLTKAVKNCTVHRRPLIEAEFPKFHEDDFARYAGMNFATIEAQAAEPFEHESVEVDRFVENRIFGIEEEPYLDRFEVHVAVELCSHLGKFMKRQAATWSLLPASLRSSSPREAGFHIARQGADAIRDVIVTYIKARKPNAAEKFMFGQLGRWLRSNSAAPQYAEIVALFQDVAVRHLPFGVGDICVVPVRKRYLHSVKSAAIQYGLFEDRVHQLVRNAELIGNEKLHFSQTYFDAEKAEGILADASRTMTSKEVRTELGLSEMVMADILNTNIISRVELRSGSRPYSRIRKQDVAEFKRKILAAATTSHSDAMSTITDVCQACGCSTIDVVSLILNAKLSKVSMLKSEVFRVHDLRVDLTEAVGLIVSARVAEWEKSNPDFVKLDDARVALRVKDYTISYLIQRGLLVVEKLTNPYTMRRQDYVSLESIRAFDAEYVALGELSKLYDTHPIVITTTMEKVGIRTVPEKAGVVTRFYRRTQVDNHTISQAVASLRQ